MTERRGPEAGFTLLETVVALAVFSLAALALIDLQSEELRTAHGLTERTIAQIIAENRLVMRMAAVDAPEPGLRRGETGMAERSWLWRERVVAVQGSDLLRIDVDVRREAEGEILARMTGFRGRTP